MANIETIHVESGGTAQQSKRSGSIVEWCDVQKGFRAVGKLRQLVNGEVEIVGTDYSKDRACRIHNNCFSMKPGEDDCQARIERKVADAQPQITSRAFCL